MPLAAPEAAGGAGVVVAGLADDCVAVCAPVDSPVCEALEDPDGPLEPEAEPEAAAVPVVVVIVATLLLPPAAEEDGPGAADEPEAEVTGTGTGMRVVPDELYEVDSVAGAVSLLLGTTAVAVVVVTLLLEAGGAAEDGTTVVSVVEVTDSAGALLVAGTGTGWSGLLAPVEEADCEPTRVNP